MCEYVCASVAMLSTLTEVSVKALTLRPQASGLKAQTSHPGFPALLHIRRATGYNLLEKQ